MSLPVITMASSPTSVNCKNFREPSFSSYLNGAEETFVLKLRGKTTRVLDSSISIPQDYIFLQKTRTEDGEIDVFDAEKYFNGGLNNIPQIPAEILPTHKMRRDDPSKIFASEKKHQITTSSIHSESSWNSRNALLAAVPRNQQTRRTNKKSFLASIGCSWFCRDKNSANVNVFNSKSRFSKSANSRNAKSGQRDRNSDHMVSVGQSDFDCVTFDELKVRGNVSAHFSFPLSSAKNEYQAANIQEKDARKRKPVEIFGSKFLGNGKNCLSPEKSLSLFTWDAIAPAAAKIPSAYSDSDSSSDLFEIESLSKGSIQASDNIFSACYAPSEASIEWSVITADADYDVLFDSDELRSAAMMMPSAQEVGRGSMNVGPKKCQNGVQEFFPHVKAKKLLVLLKMMLLKQEDAGCNPQHWMTKVNFKNHM